MMNELGLLVILAAMIIAGGYLLGYRSGKNRAIKDNKKDELSKK